MKVRVIYSVWGADGFDEPLHGGEHDLGDLTEEQARSVAGGYYGGALEIVDATKAERALLEPHVQTQEDGEKAYDAAVESGDWQEGNLQAHVAVWSERLADPDSGLDDEQRAKLTSDVAVAQATLDGAEVIS